MVVVNSQSDSQPGFDIDPDVVRWIDAVLVSMSNSPELRNELKKFVFHKHLEVGKINNGPIESLLTKVSRLERDLTSAKLTNDILDARISSMHGHIEELTIYISASLFCHVTKDKDASAIIQKFVDNKKKEQKEERESADEATVACGE